jgi:hypothetical protein
MLNYPFRRSCKEVAALVVAREDRHLDLADKLALRTHMLICKACPDFENQILTMRNAMRQWRNYAGEGGAATTAPKSTDASDDKASK